VRGYRCPLIALTAAFSKREGEKESRARASTCIHWQGRTGLNRLCGMACFKSGGLYYGWYIVGVCNFVALMTWGIGIFNQGVFLGFFEREYGWSRATLSIGPMLFHGWAGVVGIVVGRLIDRCGPRPILIVGALALGGGAVALGLTHHAWQTYPAFLLLGTGYAFLHTVTIGAIVSRWFVRERARAMAAATFGASIGGMVLVPLNAAVLDRWGGFAGGLTLAAIACGIVIPLAVWIVKDGPEALGLHPDGASVSGDGTMLAADSPDDRLWTVAEAMRTAAFWAIGIGFSLVMVAQAGFLVHQVLFLRPTFGLMGSATVVTLTTIMGTVGRVAIAVCGNRGSSRQWSVGIFALQAVGLLLLAVGGAKWLLIAGSAAFGLSMGVIVSLQPVISAECFGRRSFGRIYGPLYLGVKIGSALGPLFIGLMAAGMDSYRLAWVVVAVGPLLATLLMPWAVPPTQRSEPGPEDYEVRIALAGVSAIQRSCPTPTALER
jgi:MFS family permease